MRWEEEGGEWGKEWGKKGSKERGGKGGGIDAEEERLGKEGGGRWWVRNEGLGGRRDAVEMVGE